MTTLTAKHTAFTRMSKRTVGQHPVPCPKPAIMDKKGVVTRRNGQIVRKIWIH